MNAQNGTTGETGKPTAAEHAWLDAIRQRRNVRQLTDRLVPGDDLDQILKADRTFPTSQNSQQSTDPSTSTSWSSGSHPKTGRSSRRSAQATQPGGQAAHRSQGLPTLASHRVVRRAGSRAGPPRPIPRRHAGPHPAGSPPTADPAPAPAVAAVWIAVRLQHREDLLGRCPRRAAGAAHAGRESGRGS
jgi:hypothetical protein